MFSLRDDQIMVKAMLKLSKMAYVIGLLRIRKIWVKSLALGFNLHSFNLTRSWKADII